MFAFVLIINALWFAMAFHAFALRSKIFAKSIVPKEQRATPVFEVLAESGKFLGGFNFAFLICNILLLLNMETFPDDRQRLILLFVFAVAHGSQFVFNIPVAIQNRSGGGVWQVTGTMLFIFVTDFVMMCVNLAVALFHL